jgi:hypothetical protein
MYQLGTIVLISSYSHLFLLKAYFKTFEILPIGTFDFGTGLALKGIIDITSQIFCGRGSDRFANYRGRFCCGLWFGYDEQGRPPKSIFWNSTFAMKPTTGMFADCRDFLLLSYPSCMIFSYRMSVNAQGSITAVAEGIRWKQMNQNNKTQSPIGKRGSSP